MLDPESEETMNLSEIGRDVSIFLGGNYVNRFNMQGRSYKVIPQVNRKNRLNLHLILHYDIQNNQTFNLFIQQIIKVYKQSIKMKLNE